MRKWLAWILPCLLLFPFSAQAQASITLDSLKISLWSEYDQSAMLVIYDFKLPADTQLPVTVKIAFPKDANLTAVALLQDNQYINTDFVGPAEENNQQTISIRVNNQTAYHVEFYEPLARNGNSRTFNYQWSGAYAINNLKIEVQLPADSTAVKSTPALPFVPNQTFLTGSLSAGSLKAGDAYRVQLSYDRTSEATAAQAASTEVMSDPITQKTLGRVTLDNLPYILGAIGVLLIIGAAFYFWRSTSLPEMAKTRRRPRRGAETSPTAIYCHECGTRANAEDRFCRVCGTKLRAN